MSFIFLCHKCCNTCLVEYRVVNFGGIVVIEEFDMCMNMPTGILFKKGSTLTPLPPSPLFYSHLYIPCIYFSLQTTDVCD